MTDRSIEASETLLARTMSAVRAPREAEEALLFHRYRVVRELGRGGMGQVLLAQDEELGQPVAVKIVPDMLVKDTEAVNDLKKEVLRGMALTHPGIVRTHNFERDAQGAAIIMELVDGRTLSELKAEQPNGCFNPEQILPWIEQLCAVLDYAHEEARIVHRDLKPRNLMITHARRLKVADFGISALLTETITRNTGEHLTSGTPCYMSPQQALGRKPSPLDDVYAVGATIYELLTSKPPFFRGHILAQVADEVPPSMAERCEELGTSMPEGIPELWERTVAACLAKDPAQRPQTAGEIGRRLRGAVAATSGKNVLAAGELSFPMDESGNVVAAGPLAIAPGPTPVRLIPAELSFVRLPPDVPRRSLFSMLGWEFIALVVLGTAGVWWMQQHRQALQEDQGVADTVVESIPSSPVTHLPPGTPSWMPQSRRSETTAFPQQPTTVYVLPPPPPPPGPADPRRFDDRRPGLDGRFGEYPDRPGRRPALPGARIVPSGPERIGPPPPGDR